MVYCATHSGWWDGHVASLRKDEIYSKDDTGKIIGNDRLWKVLE